MFLPSETSTQLKFIMKIRRTGGITVDELSRQMGMTSMGVRQHLRALESKGIVRYTVKKHSIGRPKFFYTLTAKAYQFFPHGYNRLLTEFLRFLKKTDGRVKVDRLFRQRKENLFLEKDAILPERTNLPARVYAMAEMLNQDGYMVELEETDRAFKFKKFHCPILEVAKEFKDPCKYELELYRSLLHEGVLREHCYVEGASTCTYIIPKV